MYTSNLLIRIINPHLKSKHAISFTGMCDNEHMKFRVKAMKPGGESFNTEMEAESKSALFDAVKATGATLVSYEEVAAHGGRHFSFHLPFRGVKMHDKIIFARNLGSMLEAGLSVTRALSVMEKQTKQKKLKDVISKLIESIGSGRSFSDSLADFPDVFSRLFISMVRAGEESGSLAQSLKVVAAQQEATYTLIRKVRGALMYPSVILLAMVGIGIFMLTYIVPTLAETFRELNADLPTTTKLVIGFSEFVKNNIIVTIVGVVVLAAASFFLVRTKSGKRFFDGFRLKIPLIGSLVRQINAARTARTLSSLLSSGVDMLVATQITADVLQNTYFKDVMKIVEERIQKGEPISVVFAEHEKLYPPFVSEMVSVGEETGQLAQMLMSIATFYETEVDQRTKDMSTIIEPFLMVIIGAAVGFFAISMIGPIYSLGNNL